MLEEAINRLNKEVTTNELYYSSFVCGRILDSTITMTINKLGASEVGSVARYFHDYLGNTLGNITHNLVVGGGILLTAYGLNKLKKSLDYIKPGNYFLLFPTAMSYYAVAYNLLKIL